MQRSVRGGRNTQSSSFVKGLILLFILIGTFFFYMKIRTNGLPSQISSMLSNEFDNYRNLREIDSTVSDSLKKVFSGFWVYEVGDAQSPVKITDHLEFKDNGIIWQVIKWDVSFLNSDAKTFYHIRHGYINPYSMSSDIDDVICDVRTIRQSFIVNEDTCYGESQFSLMWRAKKIGEQFELNKKKYTRYSGTLQEFFPEGAIDLIDDIKASQCLGPSALTPYAKEFLIEKFNESSGEILPDTKKLIHDYYVHFLKAELIESLPVISSIPDSIPLLLTVQPDGGVVKVAIQDRIVAQSKLEEHVLREALLWKFPIRQSMESSDIKYIINF